MLTEPAPTAKKGTAYISWLHLSDSISVLIGLKACFVKIEAKTQEIVFFFILFNCICVLYNL